MRARVWESCKFAGLDNQTKMHGSHGCSKECYFIELELKPNFFFKILAKKIIFYGAAQKVWESCEFVKLDKQHKKCGSSSCIEVGNFQ